MTSLPAVNFAYGKMYCYYRDFGEITDDVFVRLYHADHTAMKYERNKGKGFADMNADNFSFLELSDDIFDM